MHKEVLDIFLGLLKDFRSGRIIKAGGRCVVSRVNLLLPPQSSCKYTEVVLRLRQLLPIRH